MSPARSASPWSLVAPPCGALGGAGDVADLRHRLVEAEGDVEEGRRADGRARPAGMGGVCGLLRKQVAAVGLVPQADAGREADDLPGRVPGGVRDADLDLAAGGCRRVDGRRGAGHGRAAGRVRELADQAGAAPGARSGTGRRARSRSRRRGTGAARRACRRSRSRTRQRGVLERVQRDAERGRARQRPDAQLDEVGGVVRVGGIGRIGVGPVRLREGVAGGARIGGVRLPRARRGRRRGSPGRGTRRRGTRPRRRPGSATPSTPRRW